MNAGRLLASTIMILASIVALVGPVSVIAPFTYNYTTLATETIPMFTVISYWEIWSGGVVSNSPPFTTVVWYGTYTEPRTRVATATSTMQIPFFEVVKNPTLQTYACTHLNLTGALFFCIMQFWRALIVLVVATLAAVLVYFLAKRRHNLR